MQCVPREFGNFILSVYERKIAKQILTLTIIFLLHKYNTYDRPECSKRTFYAGLTPCKYSSDERLCARERVIFPEARLSMEIEGDPLATHR